MDFPNEVRLVMRDGTLEVYSGVVKDGEQIALYTLAKIATAKVTEL